MPFEDRTAYVFTVNSISAHAPAAPGVYGITNAREWIYIGVADDIRRMLLSYLSESGTPVMRRGPSGFVFEIRAEWEERTSRQNRLVMEYEPVCNRQANPSGYDRTG